MLLANISTIEATIALLPALGAGLWVLWRFVRAREGYAHIEFTADIVFIEKRTDWFIVELISFVENKGKAQHRMQQFEFDLYAIMPEDPVGISEQFGGQVCFPHLVCEGSWLPRRYSYFFLEPGVKGKYSFIARVPARATSIMLHSRFRYKNDRHSHTAERTIACR